MDGDALHVERLLAHAGFMRALARSLVDDAARADDVVQDAMLAALRDRPRDPARLRAWLGGVVRNLAFRSRRAEGRRSRHERAGPPRPPTPSPAEILARENARRRVVLAVLKLDEPYRSAVVLRYLEELPPREVARRLGVPVETARTRVRRALATLREALDAEHGGDRRAWSLALVPFLVPSPAAAGVLAGALAMTLGGKLKIAGAAALVLVVTLVALRASRDRPAARAPEAPDRVASRGDAPRDLAADAPKAGRDGEAPASTGEGGVIRGRVLADGAPLPGAYVALHTGGKRIERVLGTGSDGAFEFRRTGAYRIVAAHPARGPAQAQVEAVAGAVATVDLELPPAPRVEVVVVDHDTGEPVEDAEVLLVRTRGDEPGRNAALEALLLDALDRDGGWWEAAWRMSAYADVMEVMGLLDQDGTALFVPPVRTDATGRAGLGGLLPGPFEVIVTHGAYPPVVAGGATGTGQETATLDVRLASGSSLAVIVPDFAGRPAAGCVCELEKAAFLPLPVARAVCDAAGRAVFDRLAPGAYVITISPDGTWEVSGGAASEPGPDGRPVEKHALSVGRTAGAALLKRAVSVRDGANVLDLSGAGGATLRGRVDGAEGTWLVTLLEDGEERASAAAGDGGAFRFANVPPGTYRITATRQAGGAEIEATCTVEPGADAVDVVLRTVSAVVEGLVTGAEGRPVQGALVFAIPASAAPLHEPRSLDELMGFLVGHAETDAGGRYRLEHLPAGTFVLLCGHDRALARHEIRLDSGRVQRLDVHLAPSHLHRLTVKLTGDGGAPQPGHVVVRGMRDGIVTALVLDAAVFMPDAPPPAAEHAFQLPAGAYLLDVYAEGMAARRSIAVQMAGDEATTIRLGPGVDVRLVVDGAPNASVELWTEDGLRVPLGDEPLDALLRRTARRTDASATVVLPHVAPGAYTVRADGREVGSIRVGEASAEFRLSAK